MQKVAILGAGSWGTALAILLAKCGHEVRLREWDQALFEELQKNRENRNFLPGFPFPASLHVVYDMNEALEGVSTAVLAVPSEFLPGYVDRIPAASVAGRDWVLATKGLDDRTGECLSVTMARKWPRVRLAVLAGPSLAREVAASQPTTVLSASDDPDCAERVRDLFHGRNFRVYTSDDIIGVQIGTALKNVVALAAGIIDGMGLGANAKGALMTRGLAEITRFGVRCGARQETFLGLAGVGDLVTTCSSPLSRNRSLGEAIGKGIAPEKAMASMAQVAEGVPTTRSVVRRAKELEVEMPIAEQVHRVLFEGLEPREALRRLMERPPKHEGEVE